MGTYTTKGKLKLNTPRQEKFTKGLGRMVRAFVDVDNKKRPVKRRK